jgi:hypothetical protein
MGLDIAQRLRLGASDSRASRPAARACGHRPGCRRDRRAGRKASAQLSSFRPASVARFRPRTRWPAPQPLRRRRMTTSTRATSLPAGASGRRSISQLVGRGVGQVLAVFPEEMRVVVGAGVEIAARGIDRDLVHQPRLAEGAQRVVDGGERDLLAPLERGGIKPLGGDMAIAPVADQKRGQRQPLPRRAQAGAASQRAAASSASIGGGRNRRHP